MTEAELRKSRKAVAAQIKHAVNIATALGVGAIAAGVWKPLADGTTFTPTGSITAVVAAGFLASTFLIVPYGEAP